MNETPEIKDTLCKVCKKMKKRIRDGNYNDKLKTKRWIGEDNLYWMGLTCGECNRIRSRDTMKSSKVNKKIKVYMDKIAEIKNKADES